MTHVDRDALRRLREAVETPVFAGTRYEVIEPIARGGMGVVFRARDRDLDREVAIKVLGAGELDEQVRARMLTEAHILARLEHPGIVPVHDVGVLADGRVFYAMKLVRGSRLDDFARAHRDLNELLRVFGRVCEAVAFAHSQGVVHRDLKPANVMVGAFGEVQVMDWGVAKIVGETARGGAAPAPDIPATTQILDAPEARRPDNADTDTGAILGTPGYMAPEQARGESARVDARSDVFALGAMLRFLAETASGTRVPRRLRAICDKASAASPLDRYTDAESLAGDVARFATGQAVGAYRERPIERLRRLVSRHRTAIALVAAYLLMRILIFLVDRF